MPITLPNTGLICPELGDSQVDACNQLKALFTYVDTIDDPTAVPNETSTAPSGSWSLVGDADCAVYTQNVAAPSGVSPANKSISIYDAAGNKVNMCYRVTGALVILESNTPDTYTIVYA